MPGEAERARRGEQEARPRLRSRGPGAADARSAACHRGSVRHRTAGEGSAPARPGHLLRVVVRPSHPPAPAVRVERAPPLTRLRARPPHREEILDRLLAGRRAHPLDRGSGLREWWRARGVGTGARHRLDDPRGDDGRRYRPCTPGTSASSCSARWPGGRKRREHKRKRRAYARPSHSFNRSSASISLSV